MGNFDDIVEKGKRKVVDNTETPSEFKGEPINIVNLLEGPDSPFSEYLQNLNPEMKSKVLVPLAGLLDKYGLGESLSSSPAATGAVGLMSVIGDIAPVLKGLADFVSGQRNGLAAEDKKFLQEILNADESADFSELFSDVGEAVEESPQKTPAVHPLIGELPEIDISQGEIDWMSVLDPDGNFEKNNEKKAMNLDAWEEIVPKSNTIASEPKIKMPSLEELALQAGVSMEDLNSQDSNIKPEQNIVEQKTEFSENLVDSIMDVESTDEIFYLDDEEYENLVEQGHYLEAIDEEE
ncbi:MAG TPA: hypothetical protein DCM40_32395 [Maribacter sp.]|nr:hypothetical protein [Maribacter sp.]